MLDFIIGKLERTAFYTWFVRKVLPFLAFRIWGNPTYPMENYYRIREIIKNNPDKIFVFVGVNRCAASYYLNKLLTGAKWSHAGHLYLDEAGEVRMNHMINSGFEDWSLLDYLREIDGFELLTLPVPPEKVSVARARLERLKTKRDSIEYDFNFNLTEDLVSLLDANKDFTPPLLYCSELVWILGFGLVDGETFLPHWELGRKTFEPDDVHDACCKLQSHNEMK